MQIHRRSSVACEAIAARVARELSRAGAVTSREGSRWTASEYVYATAVPCPDGEPIAVKIRVSDHADRGAGALADAHIFVETDGSAEWAPAVRDCCVLLGLAVPARAVQTAQAARAEAAGRAARTRHAAALAAENAMLAAVTAALGAERLIGKVAAGRIVDHLYPGIPRAQRRRLAEAASRTIRCAPRFTSTGHPAPHPATPPGAAGA